MQTLSYLTYFLTGFESNKCLRTYLLTWWLAPIVMGVDWQKQILSVSHSLIMKCYNWACSVIAFSELQLLLILVISQVEYKCAKLRLIQHRQRAYLRNSVFSVIKSKLDLASGCLNSDLGVIRMSGLRNGSAICRRRMWK